MQTACTHMLHESEAAGQLWFVRETHTHRFDNVAAPNDSELQMRQKYVAITTSIYIGLLIRSYYSNPLERISMESSPFDSVLCSTAEKESMHKSRLINHIIDTVTHD